MEIKPHHPQTEFTFDENGNLTSVEAKNFPGTGKTCQGTMETKAYEQTLAEAGFIEGVEERNFKRPESRHREQIYTRNQQQLPYSQN